MKNKLNSSNLINTYYDNGIYDLEFYKDDKKILVRNIIADDHPDAVFGEYYFDDDEVIREIIRDADDEDIEIEGERKWQTTEQ